MKNKNLKQTKILLVEDDKIVSVIIKNNLENIGYKVKTVSTAETALETVKSDNTLDLILMDIELGSYIDGATTAEIILQHKDIPIIFLSSHKKQEIVKKVEKISSYGYVLKDSGNDVLNVSIKMALQLFSEKQISKSKEKEINKLLIEKDKQLSDSLVYQTVFNSIGDGVFTVDENCVITSFNSSAEKIINVKQKDAIGKKCSDILSNELCNNNCPFLESFISDIPVYNYPVSITLPNSNNKYLSITSTNIKDKNKKNVGRVQTIRDLSEIYKLKEELHLKYKFENIIGQNVNMQKIFNLIENISSLDVSVLIQGETGTGKELVARAIHYNGIRRNKPFICVDCSALSENLLESELFGHLKGSFTGAISNRIGRFELADKGTLFLDEIANMNMSIQKKLLRVLETKKFEKVGSSNSLKTSARIIAATNKNLSNELLNNTFREDLFYRLNTIIINLPPLRERKDDIPYLINYFVNLFKEKYNSSIKNISPETLTILYDYDYPGNIRQLKQAIEYAFIHCHDKYILPIHLPLEIFKNHKELNNHILDDENIEKQKILNLLKTTKWNKQETAKLLNISRTTLYKKLKKHNIL
jgi:PAS domain S-box-containing protein